MRDVQALAYGRATAPMSPTKSACYYPNDRNRRISSMLYLSQVLGRPILDLDGERVATLRDVIVRLGEEDHPPVAGFVARYRRRDFFLPRWRIAHFGEAGVRLNSDILDLRPFVRREGEKLLARDVLDKQLIDVDGKRVVRVNDVQIIEAANEWRGRGADVCFVGLWGGGAPPLFLCVGGGGGDLFGGAWCL